VKIINVYVDKIITNNAYHQDYIFVNVIIYIKYHVLQIIINAHAKKEHAKIKIRIVNVFVINLILHVLNVNLYVKFSVD
jgi:hypothetical protein